MFYVFSNAHNWCWLYIADSSALVALSICDCLTLLEKLFGEVKVPQAVCDEVCVLNKAESAALKAYLAGKVCNVEINTKIEKFHMIVSWALKKKRRLVML